MRTALILLFVLALAAVPGSLLPQEPRNPFEVAAYKADHPLAGRLLARLGMFDVFGSAWFALVYGALAVSLVGCLVPRIRLHARQLIAAAPAPPRSLGRLPDSIRWEAATPVSEVLASARAAVGRGRVASGHAGDAAWVAVERGRLRESGNLLFHVSLLSLLAAIAFGSLFGFQGVRAVTEGETFSNSATSYDALRPGMFASAASASPFTVTLDDFRVQYRPDASPESFAADVRWQSMTGRDGQRERRQTLQVNHPLSIAGARVYLLDHGFAVDLEVRGRDGAVLRREAVQLSQFGPNFISRGVLKVPFTGTFEGKPLPQLGFDVVFYPTIGTTSDRRLYSRTPDAQIPALVYTTYAGDLGLAAGPQNVNDLDLTNLVQAGEPATLFPGQTSAALPGGATLHFVGVKEYAVLQVTRDPGKLAVLISAVLALVGLLLSLRVRRRRIWVRAEPGEGGTVVTVGGLARSDSDALRREVSRVVDRLGGPAPPDPITQED